MVRSGKIIRISNGITKTWERHLPICILDNVSHIIEGQIKKYPAYNQLENSLYSLYFFLLPATLTLESKIQLSKLKNGILFCVSPGNCQGKRRGRNYYIAFNAFVHRQLQGAFIICFWPTGWADIGLVRLQARPR